MASRLPSTKEDELEQFERIANIADPIDEKSSPPIDDTPMKRVLQR